MRAFCVSDKYCQYKTDAGFCGYTGNGCWMDVADIALPKSYKITKLVDLSPDSINQIADAVIEKLRKERMNEVTE